MKMVTTSAIYRSVLAGLLLSHAFADENQPSPTVEVLLGDIRSGEYSRQVAAIKTLPSSGEKVTAFVPDLVRLLDGPYLGSFRPMSAAPWANPPPPISKLAAAAILKIGPDSANELALVIKDEKINLRLNAVYLLAQLGADRNYARLIPAASDPDPLVRALFMSSTGRVMTEEAINLRLAALNDVDGAVRSAAALGFRWQDPPTGDSSSSVPNATRPSLQNFPAIKVAFALCPLLRDPEPGVRAAAAAALGPLGRDETINSLLEILGDPELAVRSSVTRALGELGNRRVVTALVGLLSDPEPSVAIIAAESLGALRDPMATKSLVLILDEAHPLRKNRDASISCAAARALGKISDRRAVPALIDTVKNPERATDTNQLPSPVAISAVEALVSIGDLRAVDPLLEVLRSRKSVDYFLPKAIVSALGELRDPRCVETLADLFFRPDSDTSASGDVIAAALEKIPHPCVALVVGDHLAASPTPYHITAARLMEKLTGFTSAPGGQTFSTNRKVFQEWWSSNRQRYADDLADFQSSKSEAR